MAAAGAATTLYFFNPSAYGFYPVCQFHRLTGLNCPGCGATRALYALLHGNFSTAMHDNALVVTCLAAAIARVGWIFGLNRLRGRPNGQFFPARWLAPLLVVMGVFGVLRNLLRPSPFFRRERKHSQRFGRAKMKNPKNLCRANLWVDSLRKLQYWAMNIFPA